MFQKLDFTKISFVYILSYVLFLKVLTHFLKVDLTWVFTKYLSFQEMQSLYPTHPISAYIIVKILPFLGLFLFLPIIYYLFVYIPTITYLLDYIPSFFENLKAKSKSINFLNQLNDLLQVKIILMLLCVLNIVAIYTSINPTYNHHLFAMLLAALVLYSAFMLRQIQNTNFQLAYLLFFTFLLRYIYYLDTGPFDIQNDSLARVAQVYSWQAFGGIPGSLAWPPAHHYLMFLISKLLFVPFEVSGRILSLASGVIIVPFAYKLFTFLFNKTTAFLSLLFISFNPYFIKYATIQMTEIPFICLMIIGIYCGFKYFKTEKNSALIVSAISINIAALLRFEAWIIIPLFVLIYAFRYLKFKHLFIWVSLVSISTIIFACISFLETGNPIYGVTASDVEVVDTLINTTGLDSFRKLISWPWIPLYFLPLIAAGIIYSLYKGVNKYLVLLITVLSSYYFFKIFQLTLMPFWRYLFLY